MASRCSKRTLGEVVVQIFANKKFSVSPDSELDESEFEISSLESDYNANSSPSCDGGGRPYRLRKCVAPCFKDYHTKIKQIFALDSDNNSYYEHIHLFTWELVVKLKTRLMPLGCVED